jgi:hypothetical protein
MGINSLAEMVSGDGKRILKHVFEGDKSASCNATIWPNQQKPGKKDWEIWQEWLAHFVVNRNNLRFRQPIGRWTEGGTSCALWWDDNNGDLYQRIATGSV